MAKINKNLSSAQFLAALAESGSWIGGIPFVFDVESESGKIFLKRLVSTGLSANSEEIFKAILEFFDENKKWGMSIVRFAKLDNNRFEVGLNPDNLAIDFSAWISRSAYSLRIFQRQNNS